MNSTWNITTATSSQYTKVFLSHSAPRCLFIIRFRFTEALFDIYKINFNFNITSFHSNYPTVASAYISTLMSTVEKSSVFILAETILSLRSISIFSTVNWCPLGPAVIRHFLLFCGHYNYTASCVLVSRSTP